jgi:GT2 family glycosyltransferase
MLADNPDRFEVVVVDDGGPESLEPIVEGYRDRFALRLVVRERGGPAAARNDGANAARGRFLAFIDDDCVVAPGWLSALAHELTRRPDCLLGGSVMNGLPDNPYSTATQRIATYVQEYQELRGANERFFTTNNLALSAQRFHELGGFDTSIPSATAEDKEFCDRWRFHRYEMAYVPSAVVFHKHDLTLRGFLRQHYNYGRGNFVYRLIRRRRGPSHVIPEPLSFYRNLILFALRDPSSRCVWRDLSLMVASQLASIAGALRAALLERPRAKPSLAAHSRSGAGP